MKRKGYRGIALAICVFALLGLSACVKRESTGLYEPTEIEDVLSGDELMDMEEEETDVTSEEELTDVVEEEVSYESYEALGNFSEGLALVRRISDGRLVYIDKAGSEKIILEEQYQSATNFSEGRAVLCTAENIFLDKHGVRDNWSIGTGPSYEYAMIDTEGNIVVEPGLYQFIGKTVEGKTFVYKVEEDYQGTRKTIGFIDSEGNLLFELDSEDYVYWDGSQSELQNIFYHQGTAILDNITTLMDSQDIVDASGNIIQHLDPSDIMKVFDKDLCIIDTTFERGDEVRLYDRTTNEIKLLPTETFGEYMRYGYFEAPCFVDGYVLVCEGDPGVEDKMFLIIDEAGNLVSTNEELNVSNVRRTTEDAWVLELQNDYWGIVDHNGELLFEPVQGQIVHLGEGLYYSEATGTVFNKYGEDKFIPEGRFYGPVSSNTAISRFPYIEGLMIVNVNGVNRFMDLQGNII